MRHPHRKWAAALALAVVAASLARAGSTLDGHPSVTRYLKNDAPFVVFGVTPTSLHAASDTVTLTFIATDPLSQVSVFPYVRHQSESPSSLRDQINCGPRDMGSWNCRIPVTALLQELREQDGELGLRIEAHGDARDRNQHSTVLITVPVKRLPAAERQNHISTLHQPAPGAATATRGIEGPATPARNAVPPRSAEGAPQRGEAAQRRRGELQISG